MPHVDDLADCAATAADKITVIDMGVYEMDRSGITEVVNIVQVRMLTLKCFLKSGVIFHIYLVLQIGLYFCGLFCMCAVAIHIYHFVAIRSLYPHYL